jgi:hypothetical protein
MLSYNLMKTLLKILPMVLLCSCAMHSGRQVSDKGIVAGINAPQTLQMLGETYVAGYSASEEDKGMVEYFRAGEDRKSWKKMMALRFNAGGPMSLELAQSAEISVKQGGASAVRMFKGTNSDSYGIEFTLMSKKVVELDVFRYVNRTNGPGTISFQFAERIPSEDLRAVGESKLPDYYAGIRAKVVKAMESTPMPVIEQVAETKGKEQ